MKKHKGEYLVTGGAGFIGSNLCRMILKRGQGVICLDNFSTSTRDNIRDIISDSHFTLIEEDVRNLDKYDFDVDGVYHLAATCGVPRVLRHPLSVILNVIEGCLVVLRWARDKRARVVYVSSSEVYGDPQVHPQPESYRGYTDPVGQRSPYVSGKRAGEALCRAYNIEQDLSVGIARLFNVYGPGFCTSDPRVTPCFIQAAESGQDLDIFGADETRRSFCYVDDIVRGLVALMESEICEPVNIGYPDEISISELARMILEITGSKSAIRCVPAICEDPKRRCPDISLARRLLGWEPEVSLRDGLRRTVTWWRNRAG